MLAASNATSTLNALRWIVRSGGRGPGASRRLGARGQQADPRTGDRPTPQHERVAGRIDGHRGWRIGETGFAETGGRGPVGGERVVATTCVIRSVAIDRVHATTALPNGSIATPAASLSPSIGETVAGEPNARPAGARAASTTPERLHTATASPAAFTATDSPSVRVPALPTTDCRRRRAGARWPGIASSETVLPDGARQTTTALPAASAARFSLLGVSAVMCLAAVQAPLTAVNRLAKTPVCGSPNTVQTARASPEGGTVMRGTGDGAGRPRFRRRPGVPGGVVTRRVHDGGDDARPLLPDCAAPSPPWRRRR